MNAPASWTAMASSTTFRAWSRDLPCTLNPPRRFAVWGVSPMWPNTGMPAFTIAPRPDHWHAAIAVLACQAGKDAYVEKPFAYSVKEGRAIVEAARRYNRIVMAGTQHRSSPHIAEAARMVQNGEIGEVHLVRVWNSGNIAPHSLPEVPDLLCCSRPRLGFRSGPAPSVPFNKRRFLGTYRQYYDYGGGYLTDYGNHRGQLTPMTTIYIENKPYEVDGNKNLLDGDACRSASTSLISAGIPPWFGRRVPPVRRQAVQKRGRPERAGSSWPA